MHIIRMDIDRKNSAEHLQVGPLGCGVNAISFGARGRSRDSLGTPQLAPASTATMARIHSPAARTEVGRGRVIALVPRGARR